MRAKVIVMALAVALAALLPAIYFHTKSSAPVITTAAENPAAENQASATGDAIPPLLRRISQRQPLAAAPVRMEMSDSAEEREAYVLKRKSELTELGMSSDPAALKTILSELENPDVGIRKTALSATIDFGSKDAIPNLENEASWASDPQEKVDIQKAIEFLQLPHLGGG